MCNLKIFNGNCPNKYIDYRKISFEVNDSALLLTVSFEYLNEILERSISLDLSVYSGKVVQLNLYSDTSPMNLKAITLFEYVDRVSGISTLSNNLENMRSIFGFCRVIFDEALIVSFFDNVGEVIEATGASMEFLQLSKGKTVSGSLLECSPVFAQQHEKFMRKAKMVGAIDQYNSIAYLECQIDVLSRIVRAMLSQIKPDIADDLIEILERADGLSVLDVKDRDKVLAEFNNKQHIRSLQREYYNEKSAD